MRLIHIAALCAFAASAASASNENIESIKAALKSQTQAASLPNAALFEKEGEKLHRFDITAEKTASIRKAFPDFPSFAAIQARMPADLKGRAALPLEEVAALFPELKVPSADAIRARIPAVGASAKDRAAEQLAKAGADTRLPSLDAMEEKLDAAGDNLKSLNLGGVLSGRKLKDEAAEQSQDGSDEAEGNEVDEVEASDEPAETDEETEQETQEETVQTEQETEEAAETTEEGEGDVKSRVAGRVERAKQRVKNMLNDDKEEHDEEHHDENDSVDDEAAEDGEAAQDVAQKVEGENRRLKDAVKRVQNLVQKAGKTKNALGDRVKKTLDRVGRNLQAEGEKRPRLGALSDLLSDFKLPSIGNLELPKLSADGNGVTLPSVDGVKDVLSNLQDGDLRSTDALKAAEEKIAEVKNALDEKSDVSTETLNLKGILDGRKLTRDDTVKAVLDKVPEVDVKGLVRNAEQKVDETVGAKKSARQWGKRNGKKGEKKTDKKNKGVKREKKTGRKNVIKKLQDKQ